MRVVAITQARERLDRARGALSRMRRARLYSVLDRDWTLFLHAAGLVYAKLGEGASGCPISTKWISRKRQDRKADELLSYIHQARNGEEHGLEPSIGHAYEIKVVPDEVTEFMIKFDANGDAIFLNENFEPTTKGPPLSGALRQVTNSKFGDTFPPPTAHLGNALAEPTAFEVAELAITYLEGLIAEAAQLPQRP